jgi:hypothetical protein
VVLGLTAGLMIDIYYPNAIFLLAPALEALAQYFHHVTPTEYDTGRWPTLLAKHMFFLAVMAVMLVPTFVMFLMIYGHARESGYPPIFTWNWESPALLRVLFSPDHGMELDPILVPAILGLAEGSYWRFRPITISLELFGSGRHFVIWQSVLCVFDTNICHGWDT